ncbi:MAG: hypothetical protein DME04_01610 [Candidatus Rokuibacteriota bacterium]|nr:MAG: hypothetical protein DME04_01610 [Candidatus Rokubacteria bacterium]
MDLATEGNQNFRAYKAQYVTAVRKVLYCGGSEALSEAAFPAYAHENPWMNFLFWERLRRVMREIERTRHGRVLDFGCGGGAMLPFLARHAARVTAADINLGPLHQINRTLPLPANVETYDLKQHTLDELPRGGFDLVLALDVLEHVQELEPTVAALAARLADGGKFIVSGPTENWAYRTGRRLAGREFTGHYHTTDIYQIKGAMAKVCRVSTVATLFYPIALFKIYSGTRK